MEHREMYTVSTKQDVGIVVTSRKHKAYAKALRAAIMLMTAIYEMCFDETAPKARDVLKKQSN